MLILTFRKSGLLSFTAYLLKMQTYIHREMQCAWEAGPGRSERNLSGPSSVHGVTKSQTGLSNFHTHSAYQAMCILWTSYQHTHAPIYSYSCFAPISTIESSLSTHEELVPGPPPPPLAHAIKCVWVLSHVRLPGLEPSSVHGIFQAKILEWVAIPFSRESSQPRYWTWVSYIGRQVL